MGGLTGGFTLCRLVAAGGMTKKVKGGALAGYVSRNLPQWGCKVLSYQCF